MNRAAIWTARILLESMLYGSDECCFVTLTYCDEKVPADYSVRPRDLNLFLKRLARSIAPRRIRYYAVGEYGGRYTRPHYHVILFGLGPFSHSVIADAWCDPEDSVSYGRIHIGELNAKTARYTCGYIVKGMTRPTDPRCEGRHPEFCRMSLRPGIGAGMADQAFAKSLTSYGGAKFLAAHGDVFSVWRSDGKLRPLGRYLRRRLRMAVGMDPGEPEAGALLRRRELILELDGSLVAREKREQRRKNTATLLATRALLPPRRPLGDQ